MAIPVRRSNTTCRQSGSITPGATGLGSRSSLPTLMGSAGRTQPMAQPDRLVSPPQSPSSLTESDPSATTPPCESTWRLPAALEGSWPLPGAPPSSTETTTVYSVPSEQIRFSSSFSKEWTSSRVCNITRSSTGILATVTSYRQPVAVSRLTNQVVTPLDPRPTFGQ